MSLSLQKINFKTAVNLLKISKIAKISLRNGSDSNCVKAAVLKEFGSPLQIENIELKKLKKNEVRIKVKYCSVNQSDQQILQGQHDFKPELPFVPGYEVAGEIIEVGSVAAKAGFKSGDKVIGLNKDSCGGFSQQCTIPIQDCFRAPSGVPSKIASALLDGYTTALLGLARRGKVQEGDTVLVTAAGGGVGLAAVDLAYNVYRAKVIAVCSTEDKASLVREKGAFAALKYGPNLEKKVLSLTEGKGVTLVFDATGGEVLENALKCVSIEGRVVLASNAARNTESFSPSLLLPRSISLVGVSQWHYRQNDLELYRKTIEDVIDMAEQELICPHVSKVFELESVNLALQYLLDAKCTGKVVLELDD